MNKKPVMLMILDGFGISDNVDGNAVREAKKPNYDGLKAKYPHTTLSASGLDVGLPKGQMGNSEVGHLNIGAGRIIYQELTRITKSIKDGDFFENKAFNIAIDEALKNNSAVHLMGLLSDGGVHSHINHVKALISLSKRKGVKKVFVHCFLDGRDVSPTSSKNFIEELQKHMDSEGIGEIATISGRYYAMDRDNRWERVQLAYNAIVNGEGNTSTSPFAVIDDAYHDNKTDEFVIPSVIVKDGKPVATIKNKDSIIFFNFRPDRAREITRAIKDKDFKGFERESLDITYVCMTQYDKTIEDVQIAYKPESYDNTLGEYVSSKGLKQLRIAETEKYAHVTFFFNGGVEEANEGEDRVLIPSPKVATYDLKPEMSAYEVTDAVLENIEKDEYDLIILNFANPDMVGHTGVIEAAVKAIEVVDHCLGKVVSKMLDYNGTVFITADHGNAESMIDYSTGKPMTAHTTNLVPFIYVCKEVGTLRSGGILADIAPTILTKMGLEIPSEMSGKSLI
ncbi:2,3-bisphosphoglycerate-independent phosphoglycerate mutase [uncultured Clostridium sp.]|uniref:2,3-bisphosphoglycerate-independent phosphoglycerate mutase n=1 Tax=uncultured Clostridium sp. TaxID=59620 RepID=UPI003216654C